jgi:PST family polysaccharide transporter
MKYTTLLNVVSKLVFTIAVFVFIKNKNDYLLQPLFVSLGYVVSGVIALFLSSVDEKLKYLLLLLVIF